MTALVFGKLPAHGDFVARGVTAERRETLDAWLSASLVGARDLYGAEFDERFDRAAPWLCEGDRVAGAITPSQDSAGRRFPLLLLCEGSDAARCEELLYAAIGEGWTIDRLATEAGPAPNGSVSRWWNGDRTKADDLPADLLTAMLA